ncbi:hypothetical protein GFK26_18330 [Variovorax paradoxus]|uniref:Uncharacterized protein n=1 Tax=Variovorax paradoxus TaxID=34073 RepID=A0A5Q0M568_VARPD|nr:hypothetical protein [Variovorax paradoxus]QFZ84586.1 hypothetical protein GFK26_18330 [Variovorax paradoxus]
MARLSPYLAKFKASEPTPNYLEQVGPPTPWKLYEAVVFADTGTKPPMDSFRFARMKHEDRIEAIEFYRGRVVQQEMVHTRALAAIEAEARRERDRERRLMPDLEERLGAW